MEKILKSLHSEMGPTQNPVLTTIMAVRGSGPQIPGASAIFIHGKLFSGTLGGGAIEAHAAARSVIPDSNPTAILYDYRMNAGIEEKSAAVCGGTATVLMDPDPGKNKEVFSAASRTLESGKKGVLASVISGKNEVTVKRYWLEEGKLSRENSHLIFRDLKNEIESSLEKGNCFFLQVNDSLHVFLHPIFPKPELFIAGAGHIGKALAHFAKLIDFKVTVIDNRPEFANPENVPEADRIITGNIGDSLKSSELNKNSYVVIVSKGHHDDSEALRACIASPAKYIGMIGSKRKISLVRENFIQQGWADAEQFDRIYAPVGVNINSVTPEEIAVSICAQLIQVRNQGRKRTKSGEFNAVILAAGESHRMGKPKMLLPFGEKSIIETVVSNAAETSLGKIVTVLGADAEKIQPLLEGTRAETVINSNYKAGMLSSVQKGIKSLPADADGIMVILGDQPMVGAGIIEKILQKGEKSFKGIIVATFENKRGHPLLIKRKYFNEVMQLPADKSLKEILIKYPGDIEHVETGRPEVLRDIDLEQEYIEELKNKESHD